jgi:hypothetical protein
MSAPRVSGSLPKIYQQQFNRLQNPAVADFMRPALRKTYSVTQGFGSELMDRQMDLAFRLDSLDQALAADRLPVLAQCRKILPLAAAYNTEDLLSLVQSDQQTFQHRTGFLAAQCAQLSRGEITDLAQKNAEVSLPVLWKLLNSPNIKDLVYRSALAHIKELKDAGIDVARMMNLNDPDNVRSLYEQAMSLGPIQKVMPQALTDLTGKTKRQIESDASLFTVYADEIAQALGRSLLKKAADFSGDTKKSRDYLSLAEGLIFRKGQGVEFVLSPRNLTELHAGKLSGDCTANASPFENIGAGMNFHKVPQWISDQTHFILLQYYNNRFFAKYNLAICADQDSNHHLFLHAAESAVALPHPDPAEQQEYDSVSDIYGVGARQMKSIARSGNILSVPASMVTNVDLYDDMEPFLATIDEPLSLTKADKGRLPLLFAESYSEARPLYKHVDAGLQWNGFEDGVDTYNVIEAPEYFSVRPHHNPVHFEEIIRRAAEKEGHRFEISPLMINLTEKAARRLNLKEDEIWDAYEEIVGDYSVEACAIAANQMRKACPESLDDDSLVSLADECDKLAMQMQDDKIKDRILEFGLSEDKAARLAEIFIRVYHNALEEMVGEYPNYIMGSLHRD